MESTADRYIRGVTEEIERLRFQGSDDSDDSDEEQPATPDPSASMSPGAFLREIEASQTYAVLDRLYDGPPFPCNTHTIPRLQSEHQWILLKAFAYLKAKTIESPSSLDTKADYLRAMLSYIRDCALLLPEQTAEPTVARILTGLAYKRAFRDRVHRMMTSSSSTFSEPFYEVLAYISCYTHADPFGHARRHQKRRVVVPEDVPLPPRSPSPPADETLGPPPYRARLYRTSIEELGTRDTLRAIAVAALLESELHTDGADVLTHHVRVIQALLTAIRGAKHPVATPYFDDLSEADLRAALERDTAFAAVLDELKRAADNLENEHTDQTFLHVVGRVVNHLCQPRKRTRATTRSVRFAPF